MRRLAALGITIAVVWVVVALPNPASGGRSTALALGFALIAAALTGTLFQRIRLPRVSGYLVFGMICGPYLANIITRPMARDLQLVNGLAIALIAMIAGLELNYARLKPRLGAMTRLGSITVGLLYAAMIPLLWIAWPWLPIYPEAAGVTRLALTILLTTVIVSFSPTVTIAVIADTRARGPLSEMVLAVVVITDLALIILFSIAMQFVRWSSGAATATDVSLLARLLWEIIGSFAFGAMVGALFALYLRHVRREVTIVLIGVCALLSELGPRLHFEPLLAALAAGLVVENIAQASGDELKEAVERGALPVLIVFFAGAGASLHLDALAAIGVTAAVVSAVRLGLIRGASNVAARVAGVDPATGQYVWMGLISQAGVTLGLTILVAREFPDWGLRVQSLMVALIALHELIGPVLFRAALARTGEIGRMDEPR
ncbi:MAG TPA: cation:proton antiporter [Vicinamibacterales bacterium]|nr:cation:proton antiporter [Vicinamibacterales bacterium]